MGCICMKTGVYSLQKKKKEKEKDSILILIRVDG